LIAEKKKKGGDEKRKRKGGKDYTQGRGGTTANKKGTHMLSIPARLPHDSGTNKLGRGGEKKSRPKLEI